MCNLVGWLFVFGWLFVGWLWLCACICIFENALCIRMLSCLLKLDNVDNFTEYRQERMEVKSLVQRK